MDVKLNNIDKIKSMKLRVEEAIARAKANGNRIYKKQIAAKLWPESEDSAQQVNMTNLCNGRTQMCRPEWVNIICDMTGVSADFLLGRTNE